MEVHEIVQEAVMKTIPKKMNAREMLWGGNSYFFDDPADAGNLISGSSTFSKSRLNIWKFKGHILLNIWKFKVHILLKPSLENFEHYFASM